MRANNRTNDTLRHVIIENNVNPYAEGSCIVKMGNTHVLCMATVERSTPSFLRGTGKGWITAEYGMLPRATHDRTQRKKNIDSGRTQEIQRLIGRSLRSIVDLAGMEGIQIRIDCDVLQADGGTRTASITGAYVVLKIAEAWMMDNNLIKKPFVKDAISAVSCGVYKDIPVLDLDYAEDSNAETDANFVLTHSGDIVEIQGTAEAKPMTRDKLNAMLDLASQGCQELSVIQNTAIKKAIQ